MKVWVVRDNIGREDVQGVYLSPESAMAAHRPGEWVNDGYEWSTDDGEGLWLQEWDAR